MKLINGIVHCRTIEEVNSLLTLYRVGEHVKGGNPEAFHGWEVYGNKVCYGVINEKLCWYADLNDPCVTGRKIYHINDIDCGTLSEE